MLRELFKMTVTRCIAEGLVGGHGFAVDASLIRADVHRQRSVQGGEPVIPPRRHRKYQHRYDRIAYKQRWGIEGFFAKLKQWRRIATRYEKLAANFLGFVKLASIMLWLK